MSPIAAVSSFQAAAELQWWPSIHPSIYPASQLDTLVKKTGNALRYVRVASTAVNHSISVVVVGQLVATRRSRHRPTTSSLNPMLLLTLLRPSSDLTQPYSSHTMAPSERGNTHTHTHTPLASNERVFVYQKDIFFPLLLLCRSFQLLLLLLLLLWLLLVHIIYRQPVVVVVNVSVSWSNSGPFRSANFRRGHRRARRNFVAPRQAIVVVAFACASISLSLCV